MFICVAVYRNYVYLGHVINSRLTDDADTVRQTISFYARANSIVRKFSSSFLCTKLLLFNAFCTSIHGCSVWCCMFQYSLNKLRVAIITHLDFCSMNPDGAVFVLHNVPSCSVIIRKSIYSLWCNFTVIIFLCRVFAV